MAAVGVMAEYQPMEGVEAEQPPRKKFKVSDLPLTSSQRAAIDGLVHTIKKKGLYDTVRKQVWAQYTESPEKDAFVTSINEVADIEIDRDPSLLSRDRGKAAILLQGAVDRSDLYKSVEKSLGSLIARNLETIEQAARDIRKKEVGEEVAAEEARKGQKTDEAYAKEAEARSEALAKTRRQEEAKRRKKEEMDELRAKEAKMKKEMEKLRSAEEKRKEREAILAARKEREIERKALEAKNREEYERSQNLGKENAKEKEDNPTPTEAAPVVDEKAIEEAALALLLEEGRAMAAKNVPRPDGESQDRPTIYIPKGPAADRLRYSGKAESPRAGPRLSYSSTANHPPGTPGFKPFPPPREAYRDGSESQHADDGKRHSIAEKAVFKERTSSRHGSDAPPYVRGGNGERDERSYRSRSGTPLPEADRSKDYDNEYDNHHRRRDYDHDYEVDKRREKENYRYEDRSSSRYEVRRGSRYEDDRSSRYEDDRRAVSRDHVDSERPRVKPRTDAPPEHIDRYVPGQSSSTRDRDRDRGGDRDRERDRDNHRDRDRDRDSHRDRERTERDRDRDRDHRDRDRYSTSKDYRRTYDGHHEDEDDHRRPSKDKEDSRSKDSRYKSRDEEYHRDGDDKYGRHRGGYDERRSSAYKASSSRREGEGGHIDRYQPSGEKDRGRDREREREREGKRERS